VLAVSAQVARRLSVVVKGVLGSLTLV
jgi:hypothetical protein